MIYYIDPTSYLNLAIYDHSLLSNIKGIDITYYANVRYDYLPIANVNMRKTFKYSGYKNPLAKVFSYTKSIMRILRDAKRERPDLVHIQWIRFWPLDYAVIFLLHLLGIKVIYTAHNVLPHTRHWGDCIMHRLYYKAVDKIIVHAERTKQEISALADCAEKVSVIPHGVLSTSCNLNDCERRIEELRQKHGINTDTVVFSCLGLQNKYKGTEMVFQTWRESEIIKRSDCALLVIGKNENVDYSMVNGMSNVHIVNEKVSEIDFHAYMRLSSVVLLPYISISQSGVLFSALQAEIPVLVTDVGGLADPLKIAPVGWNIGEPSLNNVRTAIEWLCANKQEIDKIKQDDTAFRKVRDAYDWSNISALTANLYNHTKSQK